MARKHRNKTLACPNCGTELREEYEFCPRCGQENHDLRVPFKTFLYEFLENITHFDTKLWNTLKVIFTKPGQLTKDYVEGKRVRYVHPARFYVFVSVIFFGLLSMYMGQRVRDGRNAPSGSTDVRRTTGLSNVLPDSLLVGLLQTEQTSITEQVDGPFSNLRLPVDAPYYRPFAPRLRQADGALLDSLMNTADLPPGADRTGLRAALQRALTRLPDADSLNVCYTVLLNGLDMSFCDRREEALFRRGDMTDTELDSILGSDVDSLNWFERRAIRSIARMNMDTVAGKQRLAGIVVRSVSMIMFLLMPFTAVLLLWIFYRKRYYWEHLIFSVHIHTIYFLFFLFLLLIRILTPGSWPDVIPLLVAAVCATYLVLALKQVYDKSWAVTLLRSALMSIPYFVAAGLLFLLGLLWGFVTL